MPALLDQALEQIRAATNAEGGIERSAAIGWLELYTQAKGEERERIGFMAEALIAAAWRPDDEAFVNALLAIGDDVPVSMIKQKVDLALAERRVFVAEVASMKAKA